MKKLIFLVVVVFVFVAFLNISATQCRCGDKPTGTTSYVVEGKDCCKSQAEGNGWQHTWVLQNNGVWQIDSSTQLTGSEAQKECCPEN